jgi:hypothetical protein
MNPRNTAAISAAICFLFCSSYQARSTELSEADLRKVLANVCGQVNDFYKTEHFPILAPSPRFCLFRLGPNSDYQEITGQFGPTEQSQVSADILTTSGKIIYFYNSAASNAFSNSHGYAVPPTPKWTEAQVIEIATKFKNIFTKAWGNKYLKSPIVRFQYLGRKRDDVSGKLVTSAGQWSIDWPQQTKDGILYRTGGVGVQLSEEYGPFAAYIHFATQYEDEHIEPIPRDKALIEARRGLDEILLWEPAKTALGNVQVQDNPAPAIELSIVRPNDITTQKSIADAGYSNQLQGRLAWVITYQITSSSGAGTGAISVYIDAKDGSLLGGYL